MATFLSKWKRQRFEVDLPRSAPSSTCTWSFTLRQASEIGSKKYKYEREGISIYSDDLPFDVHGTLIKIVQTSNDSVHIEMTITNKDADALIAAQTDFSIKDNRVRV